MSTLIHGGGGADLSVVTAAASDVLASKVIVNSSGNAITGTIASKAAATITPGATDQTIAAGQYLSGAQTIKGDADLIAGNIASGKDIFGVVGSYATPLTYEKGSFAQDATTTQFNFTAAKKPIAAWAWLHQGTGGTGGTVTKSMGGVLWLNGSSIPLYQYTVYASNIAINQSTKQCTFTLSAAPNSYFILEYFVIEEDL